MRSRASAASGESARACAGRYGVPAAFTDWRELVAHHTYRVTLRLWISYTPTGGQQRNIGYYDLHLP